MPVCSFKLVVFTSCLNAPLLLQYLTVFLVIPRILQCYFPLSISIWTLHLLTLIQSFIICFLFAFPDYLTANGWIFAATYRIDTISLHVLAGMKFLRTSMWIFKSQKTGNWTSLISRLYPLQQVFNWRWLKKCDLFS